jgi:hypothetical protein
VQEISDAMKKILTSAEHKQLLSEKGKAKAAAFRWQNTADGMCDIYRNRTASVLGVPFFCGTMNEALEKINSFVQSKTAHHIAFINAHCLNIACRNKEYQQILKECSVVFADGIGAKCLRDCQRSAVIGGGVER